MSARKLGRTCTPKHDYGKDLVCWKCGIPARGTDARFRFDFWRFVNKTDGCWVWLGRAKKDGYGQCDPYWGTRRASRAAWIMTKGPISPELEIDHLCRNRMCVRIDHMEPVTHKVNLFRARRKVCKYGHRIDDDKYRYFYKHKSGRLLHRCRKCMLGRKNPRYCTRAGGCGQLKPPGAPRICPCKNKVKT